MHKHAAMGKMFGDLRYIVVDEVHSLLRGDRGGQTLCLIERLSRLSGSNPRRIGLSATIGDPQTVGALLSAGTNRTTIILGSTNQNALGEFQWSIFTRLALKLPERDYATANPDDVELVAVETVGPRALPTIGGTEK